MTKDEVNQLTGSDPQHIEEVKKWLSQYGDAKIEERANSVTITAPVETLSKVFNTNFSVYEEQENGKKLVRINGKAEIPSHLQGVEMVNGLTEMMKITHGPKLMPVHQN